MIRTIVWSYASRLDLARLRRWAEEYSLEKAQAEARRILDTTNKLTELPRLGKRVILDEENNEELRELLVPPYVVRYTISEKMINIVRVWHYREDRSSHKLAPIAH